MRYNPDTDRAQTLDALAAQTRAVIQKLHPPKPNDIVWSSAEGRWIPNPALVSAR